MLPSYLSFLLDQQRKFDYADAFFIWHKKKERLLTPPLPPHTHTKKGPAP